MNQRPQIVNYGGVVTRCGCYYQNKINNEQRRFFRNCKLLMLGNRIPYHMGVFGQI